MNNLEEVWVFTDGGSRGNPGPAACAAVITNLEEEILFSEGKFLGETTNNMAEYEGLLLAFDLLEKNSLSNKTIKLHMDSELIVMQMNGAYRVKEPRLKEKWEQAKALKSKFANLKIVHVRREKNKHADALVNEVLDSQ